MAAMVGEADSVELAADQLPCGCCGIVVPRPAKAEIRVVEASQSTPTGSRVTNYAEEFAVCGPCRELVEVAAQIAKAHPRGERQVLKFEDRILGVLVARRLLGMSDPQVGISDVDLGRQVRLLAYAGHSVRFDQAWWMAPKRWSDHGVSRPFGHLTEDDLGRLRKARAELAAEELAMARGDVSVVPPRVGRVRRREPVVVVDKACLWCGIGAVTVSAERVHRWRSAERAEVIPPEEQPVGREPRWAKWDKRWWPKEPDPEPKPESEPRRVSDEEFAARRLWTRHEVSRSQLGASRDRRSTVVGYLCPECEPACEGRGGANRSALEAAIFAACGLRFPEGMRLRGLFAWAAAVVDALQAGTDVPGPNASPWEHLGPLDELRQAIDQAIKEAEDRLRGDAPDLAARAVQSWKDSTGVTVRPPAKTKAAGL